jgi:hypothetical protein
MNRRECENMEGIIKSGINLNKLNKQVYQELFLLKYQEGKNDIYSISNRSNTCCNILL